MLPRSVTCHDCGQIAPVRGYGRVEYDWPETTTAGAETTTPTLLCVRLTVDCPCCGVKSQEFFPQGEPAVLQRFEVIAKRPLPSRNRKVRFQQLRPMKRPGA